MDGSDPNPSVPPFLPVLSSWVEVCDLEDIAPNTGVCALLGRKQVAVVRFQAGDRDEVYAISNFDPFSKAFVIWRGIVGDRAGAPKIASPIYKQTFDLKTGRCFEEPNVVLPTYEARVLDGRVQVLFLQELDSEA